MTILSYSMKDKRKEFYQSRKGDLMATAASVLEETAMDTSGMWLEARFPKVKLSAASPQLLTRPSQPSLIWEVGVVNTMCV